MNIKGVSNEETYAQKNGLKMHVKTVHHKASKKLYLTSASLVTNVSLKRYHLGTHIKLVHENDFQM